MQTFDVIIVGAGPVGLSMALALKGMSVCLVHKDPLPIHPITGGDLRLYALSHTSINFLKSLGLSLSQAAPYQGMEVWTSQGVEELCLSAQDAQLPSLGVMLGHANLVAELAEKVRCSDIVLKQNEVVDVLGPGKLSLKARSGTDEKNFSLQAKVIIAADGDLSLLARHYNIPARSSSYHERAIVASIRCQHPHNKTAYQVFTPQGPCALLPTADLHVCSLVWSMPSTKAEYYEACDLDEFHQALAETMGQRLGALLCEGRRVSFALTAKHLDSYGKEQCIFVGDAAHRTHPLAGLGLNMGLGDVMILARLLKNTYAAQRPLGSHAVIRRYTREMFPRQALILRFVDLIKKGWETQHPLFSKFRKTGLQFLQRSALKQIVIQAAQGKIYGPQDSAL